VLRSDWCDMLSHTISGGRSAGIVPSRTKGHGVCFVIAYPITRCVTNLKVAGSRPDEVNDFYQVT
jgi:hypothetical protein